MQAMFLSHKTQAFLVGCSLTLAALAFFSMVRWNAPSMSRDTNPALQEALSLRSGGVALQDRPHDTAVYKGQAFNVFQPGQTLFFLGHLVAGGNRALRIFQIEIFMLFVLSSFLFGKAVFDLSDGQALFSVCLAASAICGAPYIASLPLALNGSIYRLNHVFSTLFMAALLVLLAGEKLHQRLYFAGACIACATLFRAQNILLLLLPMTYLLQDREGKSWQVSHALSTPGARKTLAAAVAKLMIFPCLAILVIGAFQWARFGNPLETGYTMIYAGRSDYLAERAGQFGLFSLHFLPENLYRTLLAFPGVEFNGWRIPKILGDARGNSLLYSQPILLTFLLVYGSIRNARAQAFLFVSLLLALPAWLYHNPGIFAPGYMRLSLDYLPLWVATLAVFARYKPDSRCAPWAVIMTVWSIFYGLVLLLRGASP